MFAAIFIPDFPVEAIVRLRPDLRERPVAVMEGTPPLLRVAAANERAADAGLEPGMTKLQAEELAAASETVLAPRSPEQEASAQAALLDAACGFSPRVEDTAPGLVVLDLAGLERIFGVPAKIARDLARRCSEIGMEAQVAVAANPDAAVHAARGFSGITVIPEGREQERLATLPVEVLTVTGESPQGTQRNRTSKTSASSVSSVANPPAAELVNTLESWGVRNLRALAALPEVAVTERLGQAGLLWQRMARGATSRPLNLVEPPARFEEACELEHPLESLEPLSFLLNRMLEQLCARLSARALATNELRIGLQLDPVDDMESTRTDGDAKTNISDFRFLISDSQDLEGRQENPKSETNNQKWFCRSLRLPVPMLDAKVFLKLLQLDLQAHPPGAPVLKVSIEARPAEPRRAQNGLFEASAPEPEKLEVTLARIERVVNDPVAGSKDNRVIGPSGHRVNTNHPITRSPDHQIPRVGMAEVVDTHRPDAFKVRKFVPDSAPRNRKSPIGNQKSATALRVFRPAVPAEITLRAGKPVRVQSEMASGEITWAAGPWKSSGDWWDEQPWHREEWDISLEGACYRIYRDTRGWWVEGTYD